MLTTNGLMYVGNLDEDAEETPEHKVGNIVQPWPVAKKTKVQREAALWLCKVASCPSGSAKPHSPCALW